MLDAADSAGPLKVPVVHPDCKTTTIRRKLYKVLLCAEVSQLHRRAAFTPGTRRTLWMCLLDSHSTGDGEQQVVPLQNTLPLCTAGSSPPSVSPPSPLLSLVVSGGYDVTEPVLWLSWKNCSECVKLCGTVAEPVLQVLQLWYFTFCNRKWRNSMSRSSCFLFLEAAMRL